MVNFYLYIYIEYVFNLISSDLKINPHPQFCDGASTYMTPTVHHHLLW